MRRCKGLVIGVLVLFFGISFAEAGVNLIDWDSSFETGRGTIRSLHNSILNEIDSNLGADGKQSLKLRLPKLYGNCDWAHTKPVSTEPGKTYTFSLYARAGDDSKSSLLMVNPKWKDVAQGKEIILTKEWNRYSFTMEAKERSYWLCINVPHNFIWIDALQFEEGTSATSYKNREPISFGTYIHSNYHSIFFPKEKIKIDISAYKSSSGTKIKELMCSYKINDFNGNIVEKGESTVIFDKEGIFKKVLFLKPKTLGLFTLRAQLRENGSTIKSSLSTFGVVNPPVKIEDAITPFCGMCNFLNIQTLKRIGVHWVEIILDWSRIEPEKGKFKWDIHYSYPGKWLSFLKEEGFMVKLLFWQIPKWASGMSGRDYFGQQSFHFFPKDMEDYRTYIHQVVTRHKDVVDIWEIDGEVDLTWGLNPHYTKEEAIKGYAEMVKIAAREIKSIIPDAKIGAIRPSGSDCCRSGYSFTEEVFKKCGKEFNIFPIDPYIDPRFISPGFGETGAPEVLFKVFERALGFGKKYGCNQPVYVSEIDWGLDVDVAPESSFARKHAGNVAKTYLISRMTKGVVAPCMWCFTIGYLKENNCALGLWYPEYNLRASAVAYSVVARVVENVIDSKEINLSSAVKAVVFNKPYGADSAIWLVNPKEKAKFTILTNPRSIKIFDIMGNPVKTEIKGKRISFELGEFPVYLSKGGKKGFKELCKILSTGKLDVAPVKVFFLTPSTEKTIIYLRNQTAKDLTANVSLYLPGKTLTKEVNIPDIPAGEKVSVDFSLPKELSKENKQIKVEIDCQGFDKVITYLPLKFEPCKKIAFPVKIDGNLSEWSNHPHIVMGRAQIRPDDAFLRACYKGPEDLSAKVYIGWDKDSFYLAAEVLDDKHFNNKEGRGIWDGDCIQFAFDPFCNASLKESPLYDPDDIDTVVALTKKGPSSCQFYGPDTGLWKGSEFAVVRDETKKKTFYEIKIPFIHLNIISKEGSLFGFNFLFFDDDAGKGHAYWCQNSPGITGGKDPRHFKKFSLVE